MQQRATDSSIPTRSGGPSIDLRHLKILNLEDVVSTNGHGRQAGPKEALHLPCVRLPLQGEMGHRPKEIRIPLVASISAGEIQDPVLKEEREEGTLQASKQALLASNLKAVW